MIWQIFYTNPPLEKVEPNFFIYFDPQRQSLWTFLKVDMEPNFLYILVRNASPFGLF